MKTPSESYNNNYEKLEKIVAELESDNSLSVDELKKKIAEAKNAYQVCQKVLRDTEDDLQKIKVEKD